jgi:penicillin-binding protein 1A
MVIMDPYTGEVKALYGGRGEKTGDRVLNRATQTKRQPGSSIKPLAVYTPAVEYNMLTYSSLIYDYHVKTAKGTYYPKAPGSGAYVTTQYAVQRSLNSTAVRICNALTPEKSFEFLKKRFGISTIVESEKTEGGSIVSDITLSSMALGGMAHGVTVSEMTAAYAAFGNLGMYYKPSTYYAVYDTFGDLVLKHQETGSQVVTPATANIMNRIMQTVVSGGTGGAASLGGWPVYGKTGTTDNKHDCWFAGGTPYYVSVVWCGYDNNYDLPSGSNPAPEIWRKTMSVVMEDLEKRDFNQSGDVIVQKYCTQTGCVAKSGCPQTSTGYYKSSYAPECSTHGGTAYSRGTQKISYGKSFANILQVPLPKADDWRNGEPAPSAKENKK